MERGRGREKGSEGEREGRRKERQGRGKEGGDGHKVFFCDSLNNGMDSAHEKIILDLDRFMN